MEHLIAFTVGIACAAVSRDRCVCCVCVRGLVQRQGHMSILYGVEFSGTLSREVKKAILASRLLPLFSLSPAVGSSSKGSIYCLPILFGKISLFLVAS